MVWVVLPVREPHSVCLIHSQETRDKSYKQEDVMVKAKKRGIQSMTSGQKELYQKVKKYVNSRAGNGETAVGRRAGQLRVRRLRAIVAQTS